MSTDDQAMSSSTMVQHARSRGFSGVNRDLEELLSRAVDGRFTHPAGWGLPPWLESGWVSFLAL